VKRSILTILFLFCAVQITFAQFQKNTLGAVQSINMNAPPGAETGNQQNGDLDNTVQTDTTAGFSLKKLYRGFARKDTLTTGYLTLGSAILPGIGQAYNRDYWKIPVIYTGLAAGIYTGISNNIKYQQTGEKKYSIYRNVGYLGAGLTYWASLLDGIVSYKTNLPDPVAAKASVYSALLPGLGQAYNGDWWKIPIWYGGFLVCGYTYHQNNMQYQRFKYIYRMDKYKETSGYVGGITYDQAEWYRDTYRRYRDYSILAIIAVYALNIIDANVFANMSDFEVNDNLATVSVEPAVIEPITYHFTSTVNPSSFGLKLNLNF